MARSTWQPKVSRARFAVGAFSSQQMLTLGEILSGKIGMRIGQGSNVNDIPARPLTPAYAKGKQRKGGLPVRDWTMSGKTLRALRCLSANENRATIGFNNPVAARIAHWNNLKERAFGVSPSDRNVLVRAVNATAREARIVRVVVAA